MPEEYVFSLRAGRKLQRIGNKASNLRLLAHKGFPIPLTYVCTWDAYVRYVQGDTRVIEELGAELATKLDSSNRYAVRSSANIEDGLDLSFAGQFKTVLNARGIDDVLGAIGSVWATTRTPGVQSYLTKHDIDPQAVSYTHLTLPTTPY